MSKKWRSSIVPNAFSPDMLWRYVLVTVACLAPAGCSWFSNLSRPADVVSVSRPKIYTDDQVLKMMGERRKALTPLIQGIQGKDLQEVFGVREASKTTIEIKGGTTSETSVAAPTPPTSSEVVLGTPPSFPESLGLSFPALLQKTIERDQLITGVQLLYLGDSNVLNSQKRLFLIRVHVSINDYLEGSDWLGKIKFLPVYFEVVGTVKKNDKTSPSTDFEIYSLAPEFSSYVAQESLISSQIDSLTASAAGHTGNTAIQGAAQFQKTLEESLLSLTEQPLQFASYYKQPNRFAFSFGPRRHIEQRSWINPARIFGNKYDISYSIDPGPRNIYAWVVAPCNTTEIIVNAQPGTQSQSTGLSTNLRDLSPQSYRAEHTGSSPTTDKTDLPVPASGLRQEQSYSHTVPVVPLDAKECGAPDIAGPLQVNPGVFYPNLDSTLLLTSSTPVSAETEVWIHHYVVPKSQITILGRYQLMVSLPSNDSLKALLKLKRTNGRHNPTVKIAITTPGRTGGTNQKAMDESQDVDVQDINATDPK